MKHNQRKPLFFMKGGVKVGLYYGLEQFTKTVWVAGYQASKPIGRRTFNRLVKEYEAEGWKRL